MTHPFRVGGLVRVIGKTDLILSGRGGRPNPSASIVASLKDQVGEVLFSGKENTEVEFIQGFIQIQVWFYNEELQAVPLADGQDAAETESGVEASSSPPFEQAPIKVRTR